MSKFAEVAGLTDAEWAIVREAALTAAPVFAARGWRYGDGKGMTVPDAFQITETLVGLVHGAKESDAGRCSSGRFDVEVFTDEGMYDRRQVIRIVLGMTSDDTVTEWDTDGLNPHYDFGDPAEQSRTCHWTCSGCPTCHPDRS